MFLSDKQRIGSMMFFPKKFLEIKRGRLDWGLVAFASFLLVIFGVFNLVEEDRVRNIYELCGLSRFGLKSGYVWQILSYAFLHASWMHVLINLAALIGLGRRLVLMLDRRAFFKVLLSGILGGGLCHLIMPGNDVLVGISGGVCAILSCLTSLAPDGRMWPLPISGKNVNRGFFVATVLLALLGPGLSLLGMGDTYESFFLSRISHYCHLGGLIAGLLYARWILRNRVSLDSLRRDRLKRESK